MRNCDPLVGHAEPQPRASIAPDGILTPSPAMTSIVTDRLCGSIPMTTGLACTVLAAAVRTGVVVEPGGHRYFELSESLWKLSQPRRHFACAGHERDTRRIVGGPATLSVSHDAVHIRPVSLRGNSRFLESRVLFEKDVHSTTFPNGSIIGQGAEQRLDSPPIQIWTRRDTD